MIRALSVAHYHHFSYLIISTALLGFAAAGTMVSLATGFFKKHHQVVLWIFALALAAVIPLAFLLSQRIPFDELQIIWDRRQIAYLGGYYLLYMLPFFFAGGFVSLAFTVTVDNPQRVYFWNMTGSALGAAAAVLIMYASSPEKLVLAAGAAAAVAAFLLAAGLSRAHLLATLVFAVTAVSALGLCEPLALKIRVSPHKVLTQYAAFPGAQRLATRYSPLAKLDVVQAAGIRYFPGLSIAYQGTLPQQILIVTDADGLSPINHFGGPQDPCHYDYLTSALPYHLIGKPRVCIIGAGGGADVAQALALGASQITAVELNPQVIELVRNEFAEFSGGLYRRPDVLVASAEARNFLQMTRQHFDIISISLLDSFAAASAGVYALNENHLYTLEAVEKTLGRLSGRGLLSITRFLEPPPPRDSLKMLATIAEALKARGATNPAQHIAMIRGMTTVTVVASAAPLSDWQIAAVREFAGQRSFDLVHIPGLKPDEVNRFNILPEPVYYNAVQQIISAGSETFLRNYVYNIRPATDDRPYFFDFFRFKALPHLMRSLPGQWMRFSEWGYLVLLAALAQAVLCASVFILLPMVLARPVRKIRTRAKLTALLYFLLLGLSYMFLEMGFIQKMTLFTGQPVFGAAVTLTGFLFFSGCGAILSPRLAQTVNRRVRLAVLAILVVGVLQIVGLPRVFDWLMGSCRWARLCWALVLISPLAFFMGVPFPAGLAEVSRWSLPMVAWAWSINGFASVLAAVLGTTLAISIGFRALAVIALTGYALVGVIWGVLTSKAEVYAPQ